ncbi:MAG: MaoC family dehydratase N-terminal domain-containing protein [Porticoccaceae bacterium]
MIDKKYIGQVFDPVIVDVEKWQLKFFSKAVGETNPIYFDEVAARGAGYRSILAPPTYSCTLSCAVPDPFAKFIAMGMNLQRILHAQQRFEYFSPICAGDRVTFVSRIVDIHDKRGGAMQFVIEETVATNQNGEITTKLRQTIVERGEQG